MNIWITIYLFDLRVNFYFSSVWKTNLTGGPDNSESHLDSANVRLVFSGLFWGALSDAPVPPYFMSGIQSATRTFTPHGVPETGG